MNNYFIANYLLTKKENIHVKYILLNFFFNLNNKSKNKKYYI